MIYTKERRIFAGVMPIYEDGVLVSEPIRPQKGTHCLGRNPQFSPKQSEATEVTEVTALSEVTR
jgi:hypothetical protein